MQKKTYKTTEILANGFSSESTQRKLSNEYQHDRVKMVFKVPCLLVIWINVGSALEGLLFTYFALFLRHVPTICEGDVLPVLHI